MDDQKLDRWRTEQSVWVWGPPSPHYQRFSFQNCISHCMKLTLQSVQHQGLENTCFIHLNYIAFSHTGQVSSTSCQSYTINMTAVIELHMILEFSANHKKCTFIFLLLVIYLFICSLFNPSIMAVVHCIVCYFCTYGQPQHIVL